MTFVRFQELATQCSIVILVSSHSSIVVIVSLFFTCKDNVRTAVANNCRSLIFSYYFLHQLVWSEESTYCIIFAFRILMSISIKLSRQCLCPCCPHSSAANNFHEFCCDRVIFLESHNDLGDNFLASNCYLHIHLTTHSTRVT